MDRKDTRKTTFYVHTESDGILFREVNGKAKKRGYLKEDSDMIARSSSVVHTAISTVEAPGDHWSSTRTCHSHRQHVHESKM